MFYKGTVNAEDYCKVLAEGLLTTASVFHPNEYWFIQANLLCHDVAYTTPCMNIMCGPYRGPQLPLILTQSKTCEVS